MFINVSCLACSDWLGQLHKPPTCPLMQAYKFSYEMLIVHIVFAFMHVFVLILLWHIAYCIFLAKLWDVYDLHCVRLYYRSILDYYMSFYTWIYFEVEFFTAKVNYAWNCLVFFFRVKQTTLRSRGSQLLTVYWLLCLCYVMFIICTCDWRDVLYIITIIIVALSNLVCLCSALLCNQHTLACNPYIDVDRRDVLLFGLGFCCAQTRSCHFVSVHSD